MVRNRRVNVTGGGDRVSDLHLFSSLPHPDGTMMSIFTVFVQVPGDGGRVLISDKEVERTAKSG